MKKLIVFLVGILFILNTPVIIDAIGAKSFVIYLFTSFSIISILLIFFGMYVLKASERINSNEKKY